MFYIKKSINIRVDPEFLEKLDYICKILKIRSKSEALREAGREWINDRMWTIKVRRLFLDENGNEVDD